MSFAWTVIPALNTGRDIFVSTSGSNSNSGLTSGSPKADVAHGLALMRNGFGDRLRLRCGDVFTNSAEITVRDYALGGPSSADRQWITSYGSGARPKVSPAYGGKAIYLNNPNAGQGATHLGFYGIDFHCMTRDQNTAFYVGTGTGDIAGISWNAFTSDLLLEDCAFRYFAGNGFGNNNSSMITGVVMNRCQFLYHYQTPDGGHSAGMYMQNTSFTCRECWFHNNGWSIFHGRDDGSYGANFFNHNLYANAYPHYPMQDGTIPVNSVIDCLFTEASSHGVQLRSGGTCTGNIFVRNPIGLLIGGEGGPNEGVVFPPGVTATATDNFFTEMNDITADPNNPTGGWRRWGLDARYSSNAASQYGDVNRGIWGAVDISRNIIANPLGGIIAGSNSALEQFVDVGVSTRTGLIAYRVDSNPHAWDSVGPFVDPNRTPATYNASLGGTGTFAGFVAVMEGLSKENWDSNYEVPTMAAYFRAGFASPNPNMDWVNLPAQQNRPKKQTLYHSPPPLLIPPPHLTAWGFQQPPTQNRNPRSIPTLPDVLPGAATNRWGWEQPPTRNRNPRPVTFPDVPYAGLLVNRWGWEMPYHRSKVVPRPVTLEDLPLPGARPNMWGFQMPTALRWRGRAHEATSSSIRPLPVALANFWGWESHLPVRRPLAFRGFADAWTLPSVVIAPGPDPEPPTYAPVAPIITAEMTVSMEAIGIIRVVVEP